MLTMLCDVQSLADARDIALQRVGIKDIRVPLRIRTRAGGHQTVQARCALAVGLSPELRGTHMSRFVEILAKWQRRNLSGACVEDLVGDVRTRLGASSASARIAFDYFVDKAAPATGIGAPARLACAFEGELDQDGAYFFTLGVAVPVTTLCPCSKAISRHGAHNQRSLISARVRYGGGSPCVWIEDLAAGLEAQGSCPTYPLLKREDEKLVTERAYENAKFVEDVLRDCILYLRTLPGLGWFGLEVESFESIHDHSAWAAHEESVIGKCAWVSGSSP